MDQVVRLAKAKRCPPCLVCLWIATCRQQGTLPPFIPTGDVCLPEGSITLFLLLVSRSSNQILQPHATLESHLPQPQVPGEGMGSRSLEGAEFKATGSSIGGSMVTGGWKDCETKWTLVQLGGVVGFHQYSL